MHNYKSILSFMMVAILVGCQGMPSEKPAIHPNPNMDWQEKFEAQEPNPFFEDNRSDRLPVSGTVSRGGLQIDKAKFEGLTDNGNYVAKIPVELSREFVLRGKERYDIFCSMCHGGTGIGNGIVIGYGYVPPPSFYEDRIVDMPDGELYSAIYNGVRSMPSYRHQIPVEDRWAIVAYIRALQRSRNVTLNELTRLGVDGQVAFTGTNETELRAVAASE
jgi:hypothetical protein